MNHKLAFMFSRRFCSKPCRFVLFFASYLLSTNAETVRGVQQQRELDGAEDCRQLQDPNEDWHLHRATVRYHGRHRCLSLLRGSNYWLQLDLGRRWDELDVVAVHGQSLHVRCGLRRWHSGDFDYSDMEAAYTDAAGCVNTDAEKKNLGAGEIGGRTLTPGLYTFDSNVDINSELTIDGSDTDIFIIQMTGDLMLAANKSVTLTGGVLPENIFWQVAGNVSVMAGASMKGILLVKTDVTFITGSTLNGRVLAQTACVLQKATITI